MLFHVAVAAAGEAETPATMGWSLMDLSPAVMRMGRPPLLNHGNLSGMLPERPQAFDADFEAKISHGEATGPNAAKVDHHCQICPNCGEQLTGHHCKLVCTRCGYYLSCADYY
jgi:ribosomal protein L32